MSRLEKFNKLKEHLVIGQIFKRLTKDDLLFCEKYLVDTQGLDNNAFALKVNRLGLGGEKRKNINHIWALLIQSI